jgi:hypothetical protein
MCSYNAINGIPSCANKHLLQDILRDKWGFDGYVVSDDGALYFMWSEHHYTKDDVGSVTEALKAGVDLDCGGTYQFALAQALNRSLVDIKQVDQAVVRLFEQRFELGMFDSSDQCSYQKISHSVVDTPQHRATALQTAREAIVLLKNDGILPIDPSKFKNIAVIGPNANDTNVVTGNYAGLPPYKITPLMGIQSNRLVKGNVTYAKGCSVQGQDKSLFPEAVRVLQAADIGIIVVGLNQYEETEGRDRKTLLLPGVQQDLLVDLKKTGKPMVVVLINGGPIDVSWAKNNANAIVEAWYGGQSAGTAISDVLFGLYNPSGVLPITIYTEEWANSIKVKEMNMRKYPGRTYKYLQTEPVYRFGYGLSYTEFDIKWEQNEPLILKKNFDLVQVVVEVTNIGKYDGDYTVLGYIKFHEGELKERLFGFEKIHLKIGEKKKVLLNLEVQRAISRYEYGWKVSPGKYTLCINQRLDKEIIIF